MTPEPIYCACTVTQIDPECPANGDHPRWRLHRICAWCKKPMGDVPTTDSALDGMYTHGMCETCLKNQSGDAMRNA